MRKFLKKFSSFFLFAGVFSFVINMLLLTPSLYMLQVYDRVLGSYSHETLWMLTLILAVALMVMGALELVRSRLLVRANNAIDAMLAPFLLRQMVSGHTNPEGTAYTYGLKDLNAIKSFLTGTGIFALFDAPWLPIYLFILYLMHPLLFAVALVGGILMIALTVLNEYLTRRPLQEANRTGRQAGNHVSSSLRNAEAINAMGMLPGVVRRWAVFNKETIDLQSAASNRAGVVSGMTKFVRQFLQSLALGVGAWLVLQGGGFTPGMMIAGTIILAKALGPIELMIGSWKGLIEARSAYGRLDTFILGLHHETARMELPTPTGALAFEHVSFGIRATNKVILKDVSFDLPAGEVLGIIGPSAAGKSTLARLLTGVWEPVSGKVRLDGADLSNWPKEKLGPHLGYLPQDVELFAGTIGENIARMGEPDPEKVIPAAILAGVHEMILQMPDGYDTHIGEGGAVLSGGQRQRIGLARALFGEPKLVVLDEPNASLDADGEQALLSAIQHLRNKGTSVVVITHKVSLLSGVDKLLVMQNGSVTLFGPRDAVLARLMPQATTPQGAPPRQQVATPAPPPAVPGAPLPDLGLSRKEVQNA